jgi:peptidyl-tRNA hydrolase, PTH1 family
MGLFVKKTNTATDAAALYTVGQQTTMLIVGLGNIGKEYEGTRHNLGFVCVDDFAQRNEFGGWLEKKDLKCQLTSAQQGATRVILMKPTTYMNLSGEAVQAVQHFYKVPVAQVVVVHDELDITFGEIRTKVGGGTAGHNGVKSIVEHLGENFGRVRIGIGPKTPEQIDSADFVLAKFSSDDQTHMPRLTREVSALLGEIVAAGSISTETRSFL